eukprot:TRINITY_DN57545_c0_g1_i1.p1 TRINITY_DN57545_c0_g1~~TRINITY_DN57545_c0_g1_i1.p1  ORF type:complete len:246 (-),score=72.45 TRINITY_DN57545_c0_g1_i1:176-913(-)
MVVVQDSRPHLSQDMSPTDLERGRLQGAPSTGLASSVQWLSTDQAAVAQAPAPSARDKLVQLLQARQHQDRPAKCGSQPSQAVVHSAQQRAKAAEARALKAERCKANSQLAAAEAVRKAEDAQAAAAEACRGEEIAVQRAQHAEAAVAALELELELNQAEADAAHEEMRCKQDELFAKLRLAEADQQQAELVIIAIKQERDRLQERLLRMKRRHACSTTIAWSMAAVFGGVAAMVASRNKCLIVL